MARTNLDSTDTDHPHDSAEIAKLCKGHELKKHGSPPFFRGQCSPSICLANYILNRCKVDAATGCWNWTLATSKFGHGRVKIDRKLYLPHRVVAVGAALINDYAIQGDTDYVLHRCDNPKCCNPNHLFVGTKSDNMQDCASKGRTQMQKKRNPLAPANT